MNRLPPLMAFRLFVVPALDAILGRERVVHLTMATAAEALPGARGRTTIVRCRSSLQDDGWHVRPMRSQDSHNLPDRITTSPRGLKQRMHPTSSCLG